jgi:predicted transcriptional regulator
VSNWAEKSNAKLLEMIGESVRGRRLQLNISQGALSTLSGVSKTSITRFETGKGNISLSNLLSILKTLEMVDELKIIFKKPESSPALLAKALSKKTQERVKRSRNIPEKVSENWQWGEDKV